MLQIVMVSPGTHLVKNHESLSRTNESQFNKGVLKRKCLGFYGDRRQNSLLQFTEIKILSFYIFKAKKKD